MLSPFFNKQYGIIGFGEEAIYFHDLMSKKGWRFRACFDICPVIKSYAGIQISPLTELQRYLEITRMPLFVCPTTSINFVEELIQIQSVVGEELFEKLILLHPAAAFELQNFLFSERLACFGVPGSGNFLFQTILAELNRESDISYSAAEAFFIYETIKHHKTLLQTFSDCLLRDIPKAGKKIHTVPTAANLCMLQLTDETSMIKSPTQERHFVYMSNVPVNIYAWSPYFFSHGFPTPQSISMLRELGARIIIMSRHPFDLILSVIRKYTSNIDKFLALPEFFLSIAQCVYQYFDYIEQSRELLTIVRYNNLIQEPGKTIQEVAGLLGKSISDAQAMDLWKRVGFQDLTPGHFTGGGYQKWKKHFRAWHYGVLKHLGFAEILKREGYVDDLASYASIIPRLSAPSTYPQHFFHGEHPYEIAIWEAFFHAIYDKPYTLMGDGFVKILENKSFIQNINLYGTYAELTQNLLYHIRNPIIRKLLGSVTMPNSSPLRDSIEISENIPLHDGELLYSNQAAATIVDIVSKKHLVRSEVANKELTANEREVMRMGEGVKS